MILKTPETYRKCLSRGRSFFKLSRIGTFLFIVEQENKKIVHLRVLFYEWRTVKTVFKKHEWNFFFTETLPAEDLEQAARTHL